MYALSKLSNIQKFKKCKNSMTTHHTKIQEIIKQYAFSKLSNIQKFKNCKNIEYFADKLAVYDGYNYSVQENIGNTWNYQVIIYGEDKNAISGVLLPDTDVDKLEKIMDEYLR